MINNTIHVVARNSYPPLVGMSDVAISLLLTLSQPYRTKPRDCHATICAIGASLRSQRRLRYINKCAADVHRPPDEGRICPFSNMTNPPRPPHKSWTKISTNIYHHNLKPDNNLHNRPHKPLRRIYIEIFCNYRNNNSLQVFFKKSCGK